MALSLFKHVVVFLLTPVVSLGFVHTRLLARKQHRKEYLLCQQKTTRPPIVAPLRKAGTRGIQLSLMSYLPPTTSVMIRAGRFKVQRDSNNSTLLTAPPSPIPIWPLRTRSPKAMRSRRAGRLQAPTRVPSWAFPQLANRLG